MAVMTFDGSSVRVRQDFTGDRAQIKDAVNKLIVGLSQGFDDTTSDDSAADTGAAFGQDDAEFNLFNTDRQLAALETAVKMLGTLNEQKALMYFASGLRLNGMDNQAQLVATTNAALRANVLLYPVDARGLGSKRADWRRYAGFEWRHRDVFRCWRNGLDEQVSTVPGHALRAGKRHRRKAVLRFQ